MNQQFREQVARFGPRDILVGVLTEPYPNDLPSEVGILLLNAGLVHRVGPNRLYVALARDLAARGCSVLRFDFAGLGDSSRRDDHLALDESIICDVDDALAFATARTGIRSWLLIGHCSGGILSCYVAQHDPRVVGILPINFSPALDPDWVAVDRDEKNARYLRRYYLQNTVKSPTRWRRFLTGQANYRSIMQAVASGMVRAGAATMVTRLRSRFSARARRAQPTLQLGERHIDLDTIVSRHVAVHFVFSEGNAGIDYLRTASGGRLDALIEAGKVERTIVAQSDHLFSTVESQHRLREIARAFTEAHCRAKEVHGATL